MLESQFASLQGYQEDISDICDEIHDELLKKFNPKFNILVRYEPSFDEAKLNITLVYFNRQIAEYIYDINNNKIGARKADFNPNDTNGEKYEPLVLFRYFESQMKEHFDTDVFLIAENYYKQL